MKNKDLKKLNAIEAIVGSQILLSPMPQRDGPGLNALFCQSFGD
jgi:hypothetical protein